MAAKETYRRGAADFSAPLQAIKAAQPDVIFLPAYFSEAAAIIKQARPLGIGQPFLGSDGWESPGFLSAGGEAVNNCYFTSHFSAGEPSEKTAAFVRAYRETNGSDPLALAALGYDAVNFLADGIRRAGGTEPAALQTAMMAATRAAVLVQRELAVREEEVARQAILDAGGEIVELTPDERAAFVLAVKPLHDEGRSRFSEAFALLDTTRRTKVE
ncbi:MAG: ABC transporter substrate-binding protein [Verrucomicrobiota bacterium]